LRVSGGALEEAVLFYAKNSPNVQVLRARTPQKGGSYGFFGNPRRVMNGFFKTYALIPCSFFNKQGLSNKFIPY
jgi:hypothetical protein